MIREKEESKTVASEKTSGATVFYLFELYPVFPGLLDVAGVHDERCATRRFCKLPQTPDMMFLPSVYCLLRSLVWSIITLLLNRFG